MHGASDLPEHAANTDSQVTSVDIRIRFALFDAALQPVGKKREPHQFLADRVVQVPRDPLSLFENRRVLHCAWLLR